MSCKSLGAREFIICLVTLQNSPAAIMAAYLKQTTGFSLP